MYDIANHESMNEERTSRVYCHSESVDAVIVAVVALDKTNNNLCSYLYPLQPVLLDTELCLFMLI